MKFWTIEYNVIINGIEVSKHSKVEAYDEGDALYLWEAPEEYFEVIDIF